MERLDIFIKSAVAVIAGLFSILTENFGIPFAVLLVMMILDFISGIMASIYTKEKLKSLRGWRGLVKKSHTIVMVGAVALIEIYTLKTNGIFADSISGAFITIEFVSLVENGRLMGILPKALDKFVDTMKHKESDNEKSKHDSKERI